MATTGDYLVAAALTYYHINPPVLETIKCDVVVDGRNLTLIHPQEK